MSDTARLPASADARALTRGGGPLLAIVPARGGSRGVPFKNMRLVGERPLILHTLATIRATGVADRLILSSDDPDILEWVQMHGYEIRRRPAELATAEATISDVAAYLADELDWPGDVGVFQPTSPFRSPESLTAAVAEFRRAGVDSLASCVREPHLFWLDSEGDLARAVPLFEARVNRQHGKHPVLRETGSIQLVRASVLRHSRQIVTSRHLLWETPSSEALDIDTTDDLVAARHRMGQGTVVFRLRATRRVGSGHAYHCLQLADELADQRVHFLLTGCDPWVQALVEEHGHQCRHEQDLAADLQALAPTGPRLVVNDVLDTTEHEILIERTAGFRVVNIEDLGPGAKLADWVVNALYPPENEAVNIAWGAPYVTLRPEFQGMPAKRVRERAQRLLITFGGTDPTRQAVRCARSLAGRVGVDIQVIIGPGASEEGFPDGVSVRRHVRNMAAEMNAADLIITGAGRTVYEAAATGTPVLVLAQSAREAMHARLADAIFLGVGALVSDENIIEIVSRLLDDHELRAELSERLARAVDFRGAARIGHRIRGLLRGLG
ncbi:MAG: hypothetical protein JOZ07_10155 [Solirubrobacterales bacterium]|nr:hypothetical protein [Solirubrobacterales bacterium]